MRGPVVVVKDQPGGPLDRLVADPDVTTFFNDRFHPIFEAALPGDAPELRFFDGCGCPLSPALHPGDAAAVIDAANAVIVREDARSCEGHRFLQGCTRVPSSSSGAER